MNPLLATLVYSCGIAGLLYLDRDETVRTSKALWLPIVWIGLAGSRPASELLGMGWNSSRANAELEGSPVDAAFLGVLIAAAVGVLIYRRNRARILLTANWPILSYFFFCLISITWSYHPDIALKRWLKSIGDVAMCLVIVTDGQPLAALKRLISRIGFVLLPTSLLLIKYFAEVGRVYTPDGGLINTGVSTNKNGLGVLLLVISLSTLWQIMTLLRDKGQPNRRRHLIAQSVLLAFGILLLRMAHSSTSTACFIMGSGLIIVTNHRVFRDRPARVHALYAAIAIVGGLALLLGGQDAIAHSLGRTSTFSGRTEIWSALIPAAPNALIGAGFESFWISPNVEKFQRALVGWWHPELLNEAHNGYLEVYLNLGWLGVGLIAIILITGYSRAAKAFRQNPSVGGLTLAYILVSALYSLTEAGFRMLFPMWIFFLLAIFNATGVTTGLFGRTASKTLVSCRALKGTMPVGNDLLPNGETSFI